MNKRNNLSLGVIVTARMTSKRFPGKPLAILHNKPVIQWCLERSGQIHKNAQVIIAVPDTDESEPLLELTSKLNIANFCGSELDVLERMYEAAAFFKFDVIVRVTGDCPFIDPRVCNEVLALLLWRNLDYTSNVYPNRTFPKGLDCEVFTFDCLEAAHKLAKTREEREHVTLWMQREKAVTKGCITQKTDVSHKNFCVDYPEDIARLEKDVPLVSKEEYEKTNGNSTTVLLPQRKSLILRAST